MKKGCLRLWVNGELFWSGEEKSLERREEAAIPAEGLGYAAIAGALGMASGVYAGSRTATRGEAASMLCRVLERAV